LSLIHLCVCDSARLQSNSTANHNHYLNFRRAAFSSCLFLLPYFSRTFFALLTIYGKWMRDRDTSGGIDTSIRH